MIPRPTVLLLLLACLLVAPVAAESEIVVDEDLFEFVDFSIGETTQPTGDGFTYNNDPIKVIRIKDITHFKELSSIVVSVAENGGQWGNGTIMETGRHDFTYSFNGKTRPGVVYVERFTNVGGTVTQSRFTIFLNDWDIGELTGEQSITLPFSIQYEVGQNRGGGIWRDSSLEIMFTGYRYGFVEYNQVPKYVRPKVSYSGGVPWRNHLTITKVAEGDYAQVPGFSIDLARRIYDLPYTSTLSVLSNSATVFTSTKNGIDESLWYAQTSITDINITSPSGKTYSFPLKQYIDINGAIIYGDVLDAYTGDPISGATITLTQTYLGTTHEATSDASGYRTDAPVTHDLPITITASATGYYDACYSFQAVPPYAEWYVPILMVPDAPPDIPVEDGTSLLYGYVLTQGSQQPIPGATITLNGVGTAATTSAGFYYFANVTPGSYTISASATDHGSVSEPVTIEATATQHNLALKGIYTLTITVKDADTLANIKNATISLSDGQEGTQNPAIFSVDYGSYTVTAAAEGYYPGTQSAYVDKLGSTTAAVLLVPKPEPTPAPEYPNYPPHNVQFKVINLFGAPIEGVNVTATGYETTSGSWDWLYSLIGVSTSTPIGNATLNGTTGDDGCIDFMMFESVKYLVTFNKTGEVNESMTVYPHETIYTVYAISLSSILNPFYGGGVNEYKSVLVNISTSTSGSDGTVTVRYQDQLNATTGGTVALTQTNTTSGEEDTLSSYSISGNTFSHDFDITDCEGESYFVRVRATHSNFTEGVNRDFGVTFPGERLNFGLPNEILIWAAMFIMTVTALMFGPSAAIQGLPVICFEGWLFLGIGWLRDLGDVNAAGLLVIMSFVAVVANIMGASKRARQQG